MKKTKKEDMLLKKAPEEPQATRKGLPVLLGRLKSVVESWSMANSPSWTGMYVTDPRMTKSPLLQPATGFPFRTQAAIQVWVAIQQVAKISPNSPVAELIKNGLDKSGVSLIELTPEDNKLLELATNWLMTGRAANQARASANPAPREVSAAGDYGHLMARKGYP